MWARVILMVPALWCLASPSVAARPNVAAAETQVSLAGGLQHSAYGATGFTASATGVTPALTVSAAVLLPASPQFDYYAALDDRFTSGGFNIGGGSFNVLEARLGGGFTMQGGAEIIPYFAIGYQGWNRIVSGASGGEAFYRSPLAGAGAKFDLPVSDLLVVSLGAEFLALAGGSVAGNARGVTLSASTRVAPQEHVELGLDGAAYGPLHIFARAWATHFSAGAAQIQTISTSQSGVNLGVGYSFY